METYTFKSIPELREALNNIAHQLSEHNRANGLVKVTFSSYIHELCMADPTIQSEIKKIKRKKIR